jgi:serine-type D-Ala-D-Ala carboxypeptidase (penicillin-binding protein 5/6)
MVALRWAGLAVTAALTAIVVLVSVNSAGRTANAGAARTPAVGRRAGTALLDAASTTPGPAGSSPGSRARSTNALAPKDLASRYLTGDALPTVPTTRLPTTGAPPSTVTTRPGPPPTARPSTVDDLPQARSYVLVDVNTGNVLAGHQERLRVPPASLTKVLVALIAIRYLSPNAGVPGTTVSEDVYPNQVGIEKGVPWPLHEVLESLLVYSANDAAYAIADRISGTLRAFAPVMQRSAAQIGMKDDPLFRDPAGLDGPLGFEGGNLVSARDLAIAGRDLLAVPELAQIVKQENYHFVDPKGKLHWLPSMNFSFLSTYPGAIGIKTGFTDRAGDCLMAAATRHNRTMLAVVMNGYNPTQTAIDLLNEGFATPVKAEPTTDRLPPQTLPSPPPKVSYLQPVNAHPTTTATPKRQPAKPQPVVSCAKAAGRPSRQSPQRPRARPCTSRPAA